jgi:hypothetical protein
MNPYSNEHDRRRVLIVADDDPEHAAPGLAATVTQDDVFVVAPAGPVAGERWVVDLGEREASARRRLEAWVSSLTPWAWRVTGEIGDADTRLAVGDARAVFDADDVIYVARLREPARRARRAGAARWSSVPAYAGGR